MDSGIRDFGVCDEWGLVNRNRIAVRERAGIGNRRAWEVLWKGGNVSLEIIDGWDLEALYVGGVGNVVGSREWKGTVG